MRNKIYFKCSSIALFKPTPVEKRYFGGVNNCAPENILACAWTWYKMKEIWMTCPLSRGKKEITHSFHMTIFSLIFSNETGCKSKSVLFNSIKPWNFVKREIDITLQRRTSSWEGGKETKSNPHVKFGCLMPSMMIFVF